MATTILPSNNIGTHPEDAPRTLNTNFGGEGSPTDRLWKQYRLELAERDKRTGAKPDTAEKDTDRLGRTHGLSQWLRRLATGPI